MDQKLLEQVIEIGRKTGKQISERYNSNDAIEIHKKSDNSLVTEVDMLSNKLLVEGLSSLTPNYPIISEEEKLTSYQTRKNWDKFWLIDPLDGTDGFVNKTDEFTINIALIEHHKPILGVVVVPTKDVVYFALRLGKAYKQIANSLPKEINISDSARNSIRVTISRYSGKNSRMNKFLSSLTKEHELIVCGSTVKLCLIAEGLADIYPRLGNTWEWDTAAGQCILEAAGGKIIDLQGKELQYNTKESLINSEFVAFNKSSMIDGVDLTTV